MLDSIRLYFDRKHSTEAIATFAAEMILNPQGHDCHWGPITETLVCSSCKICYYRWGVVRVLRRPYEPRGFCAPDADYLAFIKSITP